MSSVREQVMHEIATVIRQAQDAGQGDGVDAARSRFPGTPDAVLYEAWWEVEEARTNEWWTAVERTIDGEVNAGRGRLITIQSEGASEAEVDAFLQSQGIVVDPCKDVLVHLCNHFLDRNEQPVVTLDRGLRLLYAMEKRS